MTKPRLDNQAYHHLLEGLNAALPLEYAIRAARLLAPKEFERLREFDRRIRAMWMEEAYSEAVIDAEGLVDFSWDIMQLGYSDDRVLNRAWMPEEHARLQRVRERVAGSFGPLIGEIRLPFADCFRICDLLHGTDIPRLIREIGRKMEGIKAASRKEDIPLNKFVWSIRRPVPRYRGSFQRVHMSASDDGGVTHIGLMLAPDMELEDVDGALREFLYHYAMFRKESKGAGEYDPVTNELLMRWGLPAKPAKGAQITQLNEVSGVLNGLHCWDRWHEHASSKPRGARARAIDDVLSLYPEEEDQPTAEAIAGHYNNVRKRIERLRDRELARQKRLRPATAA